MPGEKYAQWRRKYDEIMMGETASRIKTITEKDVLDYAALIDDENPIHLDEEYAKTTQFGSRIAHGLHTASFITTLIATRLPGIEGVYVSQELKFKRPVYIGDTITIKAVVMEKQDEKRRITLQTTVTNQKGELIIDGKGVIAVLA